jgi:hypothetical protein
VGYDVFGGFIIAGRGINETRISVNGDMYNVKSPKRWYMSYIHLPGIPWTEATRVDPL